MKIESKYLGLFQKAKEENKDAFKIVGDVILVERVEVGEIKTASGIYLASSVKPGEFGTIAADRPHFAIVIAVGEGYYNDETKEDVPLDVKPGDVVLLGKMSTNYFSTPDVIDKYVTFPETYQPDSIGVSRESEILAKFPGAAVAVEKQTDSAQLSLGI